MSYRTRRNYRPSRKKHPTMNDLVYESSMEKSIADACAQFKWLSHHNYDSRRSKGNGLPDRIIVGYSQLIFWENKIQGEHPSDAQQEWLDELNKVTGPPLVEVIQPSDLDYCLEVLQRQGRK